MPSLNLPLDNKSSRRDWRGLLLVFVALVIYLAGSLNSNFEKKNGFTVDDDGHTPVARMGADSNCGIDPRQAVFLMQPIDLNQADAEVLASLKGIGSALASRIIAYRDQHGSFNQVVDITEVHGIGPKKLAGFVRDVTVGKCVE